MAKINTIKEYDVANGPGVRMSVWFQGCPHKCTGCFNEETWDKDGKGDVYSETHLQKIILRKMMGSEAVKILRLCSTPSLRVDSDMFAGK